MLLLLFISLIAYLLGADIKGLSEAVFTVGLLECLVGLIILWIFRRHRKIEAAYLVKLQAKKDGTYDYSYKHKQRSVFIQYLIDKHNKVCRSIDLID